MLKQIRTAVLLLIFMTIFTGLLYPTLITLVSSWIFPWQANGSLMESQGKTVGSLFIGQSFDHPKYFWGRPSATKPYPYNAEHSSGSNRGPNNSIFLAEVKARCLQLRDLNADVGIPVDLVLASGSGLDPEISPRAAYYQAYRIAAYRKIKVADVYSLIHQLTKPKTFGIFGEDRVNVLELNLALDKIAVKKRIPR